MWRVPYSALGGGKLPLPAFRWVLPTFAALLTVHLSLGVQLVRTRGINSGTLASALGKNREPSRASMERRFKRGTIAPPPLRGQAARSTVLAPLTLILLFDPGA